MLAGPAAASGAEPTRAVDRDLLAYLPLVRDLKDYSAAHLPVGVTGQVVNVKGAAFFSGLHSWLQLPHIPLNDRPFAVAVWMKPTGTHPMYGVLEQRSFNRENAWLHFMLRGTRQPFLGFYLNDAISPLSIANNEWTHVVFQFTGAQQQVWVNGQLLCARATRGYSGTNGATCLGKSPRWYNVPSKDFEGYLREFRLYRRVLTPREIAALSQPEEDPAVRGQPVFPSAADVLSTVAPPAGAPSDALAAVFGVPFLSIVGTKLTITGEARQVYDVEACFSMLQEWEPLTTLTNQHGVVEFIDEDARFVRQRYYRIKVR